MTKIEWTEKTWNPIVGCSKVSPGCANCYAERMAKRLQAMGKPGYYEVVNERGHWTGNVNLRYDLLDAPLHWRKPRMVFVNSMSDLFHPDVPDEFIAQVWAMMLSANWHTYQILTKRPERMAALIPNLFFNAGTGEPYISPNIWLGVSVENQQAADERIPLLLQTPAAVRFVSCEPLLGKLHIADWLTERYGCGGEPANAGCVECGWQLNKLGWVIVGGESCPDARPMHPDWARSLRDQCQAEGVPFFFKQWGEWLPVCPQYSEDGSEEHLDDLSLYGHQICLGNRGTVYSEDQGLERVYWCGYQPDPGQNPWFMERVGKKQAGRMLDGQEWSQYPEARHA